ncbi:MAG: hypothetical protein CMK09_15435 [Ponticaulis sp.]|nr:hypothetical protein [Ponticaulis sp.]|tara:strand:- start:11761 stop:12072 length:312 start_codon:yes stop_codon:yes gene_type:complete
MSADFPVRAFGEGCLLTVRVTPKSSRDQIDGLATDDAGRSYLKVRVRAVPENGAANKAVCQLIAKWLGVPKSAAAIHAGDTARLKQILVDLPPQQLVDKLATL